MISLMSIVLSNVMDLSSSVLYFTVLLLSLFFYLRLAKKWQITDSPNERSSHKEITIRGGGIVYVVALVLYLLFYTDWSDYQSLALLFGALVLGVLSFIDDIKELSAKLRLGVHLLAMIILFASIFSQSDISYLAIVFVFGMAIVMMNAYNFMDGINGMSFQMTLAAGLSFLYINHYIEAFIDSKLLFLLLLANLAFGVFNWRKKALCFMGDIGSISLGFIFIGLAIKLGVQLKSFAPLLILMVYFLDVVSTIIQRLLQKENILKPHRKHLYQLLANEYKMSHLTVSTLYFVVQSLIIILAVKMFDFNFSLIELILFILPFVSIYWTIKWRLLKKLK